MSRNDHLTGAKLVPQRKPVVSFVEIILRELSLDQTKVSSVSLTACSLSLLKNLRKEHNKRERIAKMSVVFTEMFVMYVAAIVNLIGSIPELPHYQFHKRHHH